METEQIHLVPDDLITQTEAAKRLGISRTWFLERLKRGEISKYGTKVSWQECVQAKSTPKKQSTEQELHIETEQLINKELATLQMELAISEKDKEIIRLEESLKAKTAQLATVQNASEAEITALQKVIDSHAQTIEREMAHLSSLNEQIRRLELDKDNQLAEIQVLKETIRGKDALIQAYDTMGFVKRLIGVKPDPQIEGPTS